MRRRRARPRRRRRGSTLNATLVDRDGDGFLEPGPGRAAAPTAATPRRPAHARHVRPAHRHARARRGVTRAGAVHGPHRRAVHVDLPPAGGVLRADARRRRARAQPRAAAGRVHHRRHHRQRAAQRARPGARDAQGRRGQPRQRRARLRRRPGRPTRPTPSTTAPTTTRPPTRARCARPSGRSRPRASKSPFYALVGNHDVLVQGEVPPTPEIDAIATGDRLVQAFDPRLLGSRATRPTRARPSTQRCSDSRCRLDSVDVPADPDRRFVDARRGRARRLGHPSSTTRSTSDRRVRASSSTPSTATARRQARITPAQLTRLDAGADHGPLGRRALPQPADPRGARRSSTATPTSSPRSPATRHKNRITRARPLLADQHVRLADFPQQARMFRLRETGRRRRAGDLDGRPRRPGPRGHLARARLPRRPGRPPAALRGYHARSQRSAVHYAQHLAPVRRLSSNSRHEGEVREYQGFSGHLRCPEPGLRLPGQTRAGAGQPVRLAVGQPDAAGQHDPGDGLRRRAAGTRSATTAPRCAPTTAARPGPASPTGTSLDLTRVQAVTPDTVIVLGGNGCVVRRSDDGGKTFTKMYVLTEINCPEPVAASYFVDPHIGLPAAAQRQRAAHHRRGPDASAASPRSRARRRAPAAARGVPADAIFTTPDAGIVFLAGSQHRLPHDRRGRVVDAGARRRPAGSVQRMKAVDATTFYAFGPDTLLRTSDAGQTWQARRPRGRDDHRRQLRHARPLPVHHRPRRPAAAHRERRGHRRVDHRLHRAAVRRRLRQRGPRGRRRRGRRDRGLQRRRAQLHAGRRRHRGLLPVRPAARPGAEHRARARRPRPARAHDRQRRHLEGDQRRHLLRHARHVVLDARRRLRARRARRPVPHRQRRRELAADRPGHDAAPPQAVITSGDVVLLAGPRGIRRAAGGGEFSVAATPRAASTTSTAPARRSSPTARRDRAHAPTAAARGRTVKRPDGKREAVACATSR